MAQIVILPVTGDILMRTHMNSVIRVTLKIKSFAQIYYLIHTNTTCSTLHVIKENEPVLTTKGLFS